MNVITLPSGKKFSAEQNLSLLDAAEQAGITLPYSCRNGRCSTCKCKVNGSTELIFDELGLTADEKEKGWKLACARSATGNVSLNIDHLEDISLPTPKIIPAKIDKIEFLSNDILKLNLRLPPGRRFEFIEGQYLTLIGPGGVARSYSLARHCDGTALELHVRRVPEGQMSKYLFGEAKVGDLLRINGPRGTFVLRNELGNNTLFFATGTGIAPIKAILERIVQNSEKLSPGSIKVYWGMRDPEEFYWDPRELCENIDFIPVLSRSNRFWTGANGYVQDVVLKNQTNFANTQIYACGSEAMIRSLQNKTEANGLLRKNFFSDAFVASASEKDLT